MKIKTQLGILILLIFVTICSCKVNSNDKNVVTISYIEKIQNVIDTISIISSGTDSLLALNEVKAYYKSNDFEPIWTNQTALSTAGKELFELLKNAYDYGLMPEMYQFNRIKASIDSTTELSEVLLMNGYYLFATHVTVGCIDTSNFHYKWKKDMIPFNFDEDLAKIKDKNSCKSIILSHQPQFWEYQHLLAGLKDFLSKYDISDTLKFKVPNFKTDSLLSRELAKKALIEYDFLDTSASKVDSLVDLALKKFQRLSGLVDDAIIGTWTSNALSRNHADRFFQAALSLEKWRWRSPFPSRYIWINIPEFNLYFVDSTTVKRKHKVIVGTNKTQTPEFHATMRRLVANPYWHVPYSIASTEILSNLKKDTAYSRQRGYKYFRDDKEVDPLTVDWSVVNNTNFRYRVRQDAGHSNSLGLIKFLFPNDQSIFVHDTPGRYLFANDVRAYSHGCIRVEHPFDLAKEILALDKHIITPDTLDSLIQRGTQKVAELSEPFEVFIEYFTTTVDSTDQIIFHSDIYGRDETYLKNSLRKFKIPSNSWQKHQ